MRWTTGLDQPALMLLALGLMVALGVPTALWKPCRRSLPVLWQGVLASGGDLVGFGLHLPGRGVSRQSFGACRRAIVSPWVAVETW